MSRLTRPERNGALAAVFLTLAATLAALAQEEPLAAETVRAKIAALDLEAAKPLVDRFKAAAKTPEAKEQARALERDYAAAKKIEPIATKQVPKLIADKKLREAYALLWAAADQFPGAAALAALRARVKAPRDETHLVVDDFDASKIPPGKEHAGEKGKGNTKMIANVAVGNSRVELVDDATGGKALRWVLDPLPPDEYAGLQWKLGAIDLADFDYATLRVRVVKAPAKPIHLQLTSAAAPGDRGKFTVALRPGAAWQEVRVPLAAPEKKGDFDPKKVIAFGLSTFASGCEIVVDEILLARKR